MNNIKLGNSQISKKEETLNFYKAKIEKSLFIFEEIFEIEFKNRNQFINYFNINKVSPNMILKGQNGLDSLNKSILNPCWDMINRGGKRWRPMLGLMISDLFKIDLNNPNDQNSKLYYKMFYLTEALHNASLIIDDVEDKSELRRNSPCVHKKYGEGIAINAGVSLMFFPFYKIVQSLENLLLIGELSKVYLEELSAIHIGQGWDIEMKVNNCSATPENYIDIVLMKTGVFPRLIVKLLSVLIKYDDKINKNLEKKHIDYIFKVLLDIIDFLSIAFQIKDDLLNITDTDFSKKKGFLGEVIFVGKLTLMVLHTMNKEDGNNNNCKNRLKEILLMNTKDSDLINEAIQILVENGSIEYATLEMNKNIDKSILLCEQLIEFIVTNKLEIILNIEGINSLKILIDYLIKRSI